ncbi:LAETG motif-containing sortase-dependent surface protein [Streptomyces sp. H39-S7]|uniref:LAETG motif-containing sortase-dependent surface protein n=1 Tax=Streptomyces sp. H39-S7 TaxID=3004357 RepID=UPI0022AF53E5|nr:LAETG motif-containing sortase-dependent surface protein [Streptomyces sp. H39-S7]MCZ4120588.1 LPXTG cell wall anchor domain-containing protein [Streptomyces sp. H39-S7]
MKLRRTLVTVAATAVIAPAALLSATTAFADTAVPGADASASASATPGSSASPSATTTATATPTATASTTATTTAKPTATGTAKPTTSPKPTTEPSEDPGLCADKPGYEEKVVSRITGLPGKIVAGSGWHNLTLTADNKSGSDISDLGFYAGVGSEDAPDAFSSKKVLLQAYDTESRTWQNINDGEGHSVGFAGYVDKLKAGAKVTIKLRLDVKAGTAPVKGLTIGGGVYINDKGNCFGDSTVAYTFSIVAAGTKTEGTVPQTGGKVPVPVSAPDKATTPKVTGHLAETGSSSVMPQLALAGGAAVAVGVGAMFVVRRRKAGSAV